MHGERGLLISACLDIARPPPRWVLSDIKSWFNVYAVRISLYAFVVLALNEQLRLRQIRYDIFADTVRPSANQWPSKDNKANRKAR